MSGAPCRDWDMTYIHVGNVVVDNLVDTFMCYTDRVEAFLCGCQVAMAVNAKVIRAAGFRQDDVRIDKRDHWARRADGILLNPSFE